jgi:hypothetical protein
MTKWKPVVATLAHALGNLPPRQMTREKKEHFISRDGQSAVFHTTGYVVHVEVFRPQRRSIKT